MWLMFFSLALRRGLRHFNLEFKTGIVLFCFLMFRSKVRATDVTNKSREMLNLNNKYIIYVGLLSTTL